MAIEHKSTRLLLAYFMDVVDQQVMVVDLATDAIKAAFHRQVLWESLGELEKMGIIRRARAGRVWSMAWINPEVIRPWFWRDKGLAERVAAYKKIPGVSE
jgi:hypothetical protein